MEASVIKTFYRDNEIIKSDPTDSRMLDYANYLNYYSIDYNRVGAYLEVGKIPLQGWVIYISVIKQQMKPVIDHVLPVLIKSSVSFKIPENYNTHGMILDGSLGYYQIGKVISIYPLSTDSAVFIATELTNKLTKIISPEIPEVQFLGNGVYAGYENYAIPGNNGKGFIKSAIKSTPWPFSSIATPNQKKVSKWLKHKYLIIQCLKNDAKGGVYKGLNFKKWSNIQWCIIKEGKQSQCRDDAGRDIKDRLLWQHKVQEELSGVVPLPKAIDFIDGEGASFFIMEHIEGKSYNDLISEIQKGVIWYELDKNEQIALIKLAIQAVEIVASLHSRGYIHRDLSPVNFMVTDEGRLVAIDIELCYNYHRNEPNPIFTLGTAGYMSPAQARCETPVIEDDIYGLGNLLVRTLTGLSPIKFNSCAAETRFENLNYFIHNRRLATVICSCGQTEPHLRPSLPSIKHGLELYLSQIITDKHLDLPYELTSINAEYLSQFINKAIQSLFKFPQLAKDNKWYAKTRVENFLISNEFKSYSCYSDFYSGAAGVIYALTIADQFGYDLENHREVFYKNYLGIQADLETDWNNINSGLYHGTGGIAIVMATMIKYGLLENNIHQLNLIAKYLSVPSRAFNIISGMAGQGLSMMKCAELLQFPELAGNVSHLADALLNQQNKDGSWTITKNENQIKGVKLTGFIYGNAGIIYFLLIYSHRYNSEKAKTASKKALNWLLSQGGDINKSPQWPVSSINKSADPWFEHGFTGIAFLFLKAYELLEDQAYHDAAMATLLTHPKTITSNYINQSMGLCGLGEVYLEAYKIFSEQECLDRAKEIARFLKYTNVSQDENTTYWLDGSDNSPTPEFMTGNAGLIHFLLRLENPQIEFPLLSFN